MPQVTADSLPWNFEAFRRYLAYDIVQQAAASLLRFDGEQLFSDPALMNEFTELLTKRTGMPWLPNRTASEGVLFNIEGSVFRNKARVFTSLYLCDPLSLTVGIPLAMTPFGRAVGLGYVSQAEFYKELLCRFEYPHPAYQDNWDAWGLAGIKLKPFIFILDIMAHIYAVDKIGEVSTGELATHAHATPYHSKAQEIANAILAARSSRTADKRTRSDSVDRKLSDMLGFLCMSGATYYNGNNIRLNLLAVHREEKAFFWERRHSEDRLLELQAFITRATGDIS